MPKAPNSPQTAAEIARRQTSATAEKALMDLSDMFASLPGPERMRPLSSGLDAIVGGVAVHGNGKGRGQRAAAAMKRAGGSLDCRKAAPVWANRGSRTTVKWLPGALETAASGSRAASSPGAPSS